MASSAALDGNREDSPRARPPTGRPLLPQHGRFAPTSRRPPRPHLEAFVAYAFAAFSFFSPAALPCTLVMRLLRAASRA